MKFRQHGTVYGLHIHSQYRREQLLFIKRSYVEHAHGLMKRLNLTLQICQLSHPKINVKKTYGWCSAYSVRSNWLRRSAAVDRFCQFTSRSWIPAFAALPVQAVKSSRSAIGQASVGHLIARPMDLSHRKGLPQTKRQAISPNAACSMRRFIA